MLSFFGDPLDFMGVITETNWELKTEEKKLQNTKKLLKTGWKKKLKKVNLCVEIQKWQLVNIYQGQV